MSDSKETDMFPDAHLYIHRAEQAARARARVNDASGPRRRLFATRWRLIGRDSQPAARARGRPRPMPGRGVLWRRT